MIYEHLQLFPTHLFTFEVKNHRNRDWYDYIQQQRNPNSGGQLTSPDLHQQSLFKPLTESLIENLKDANRLLHYSDDYRIDITSMWGQSTTQHGPQAAQSHANNFWTGIYCIAPDGGQAATIIEFYDSRPEAHALKPLQRPNDMTLSDRQAMQLESGWGVIFPSWLQYQLRIKPQDGYSNILWTALMRGDYSSHESKQWANI